MDLTRMIAACVPLVVLFTLGCGSDSPSAPSPTLSVTFVVPNTGPTDGAVEVKVFGTGFHPGATVTFDGVATTVAAVTGGMITATAPPHPAGRVDLVVTNPGGASARLTGGFTYLTPTPTVAPALTVAPDSVAPGGQLSVSWLVQNGGSWDWIGLFRVGDPNTSCISYEYTGGRTSGTFSFSAPSQPGQYDFRYLLDDGYVDVARSSPVTVK